MNKLSPDLQLRIEKALDNIRPYLEEDGGDLKILGITSGNVLEIELLGTCKSCPMSPMTLKAGVEEAIVRAVPEIHSVEAVNVSSAEVV